MSNALKRASTLYQQVKGPKWKRELVADHKFDFIDVDEFRVTGFIMTVRYFLLICGIIISALIYCADLWSAGTLLIYDHWSLSVEPKIPFSISKWIYVGCIALSFILLAWEIRKTRSVMASNDISLAVTNPLAYRTYSAKNYSYFCLLRTVKASTKWSDVIIFHVFYTLKGWKKIIVAQAPRQIIAGITVYALLQTAWTNDQGKFELSTNMSAYGNDWPQRLALISMSFTCILWIISAISILIALILYIPVLCQIQGNLKEYCCHKIDKRIDELLKKQQQKRLKEKNEGFNQSVKKKKSVKNLDQKESPNSYKPTLPVIQDVDLYWNNNYPNRTLATMESSYSLNYSSAPNRIVDPNFSYSHSEFHHNTPVVESAIVQPPETSYQSYQKSTVNYYYNTPQKSMGNTYGSSTDFDSTSNNSPTITAASTHYKTTESFTSNQDQYNSKYGMNATYRENTYTTNYQGNINENSAYSHPTTTPSLSHTQPDYTNRQPDLTTDDIYDSYLSDNPTSATNQRYNYM